MRVREVAGSLGVPEAALIVDIRGDLVPDSCGGDETLRDVCRPVWGGTEVGTGGATPCTLGFSARMGTDSVFVTASHCSETPFNNGSDDTNWFQPDSESQLIGVELRDTAGATGYNARGGITCGSPCRNSDATIGIYEDSVSVARGYIARPYGWGYTSPWSGNGTNDSLDVYNDYPKEITHRPEEDFLVVGRWVNKVGRGSGWTRGQITNSCVNITGVNGKQMVCLYGTNYYRSNTDSGAPVFLDTDTPWSQEYYSRFEVMLLGTHTGVAGSTAYFSSLDGIEADFGVTLEVCSTEPCSGPPGVPGPVVNILGPSEAPTGEPCTWWAEIVSGYGPFEFEWDGILSGNASEVSGTMWNSGWLYLTSVIHPAD